MRATSTRESAPSLREDVADVRLDRLGTDEELLGDLPVGLTVDDPPRDLELAPGQALDAAFTGGRRRLRAPVDAVAELTQLVLGGVAEAQRSTLVEGIFRRLAVNTSSARSRSPAWASARPASGAGSGRIR